MAVVLLEKRDEDDDNDDVLDRKHQFNTHIKNYRQPTPTMARCPYESGQLWLLLLLSAMMRLKFHCYTIVCHFLVFYHK